jgi:predicted dehydrogenase
MNDFRRTKRRTTILRVPPLGRLRTSRLKSKRSSIVRYGMVGLGHIAQIAVLPAFKHARQNSRLVALFSDDKAKLAQLGRRFRVPYLASYKQYDTLLKRGEIDAVYIALPNSLHRDFTVRAAEAGVHVLCEKPLALSERECQEMIAACKRNCVKLMTAYRLHFEKSNLEAVKVARSGKLGELRYFNSIFSMQARDPNIRLDRKMGGGPLWDLGVYCINAARYLFAEEPLQVSGVCATGRHKRFRDVEEMVAATLRFPGERLANFICSFGATDAGTYQLVGTKGRMILKNAYEYVEPIDMQISIGDRNQVRTFEPRDQFAPELIYFSNCILHDKEPEPSGEEGNADVRIIEALYESAGTGRSVKLKPLTKAKRPSLRQEIRRAPVRKPELIQVQSGSR